jgi:hypothetical protein
MFMKADPGLLAGSLFIGMLFGALWLQSAYRSEEYSPGYWKALLGMLVGLPIVFVLVRVESVYFEPADHFLMELTTPLVSAVGFFLFHTIVKRILVPIEHRPFPKNAALKNLVAMLITMFICAPLYLAGASLKRDLENFDNPDAYSKEQATAAGNE